MRCRLIFLAALAATALSTEAFARKMSSMEWMDAKSFEIWKSLSADEKTDSIKDMIEQAQGSAGAEDKAYLSGKTRACLDKEAADPDYVGAQAPLYIPWTYCFTKYSTILQTKAK